MNPFHHPEHGHPFRKSPAECCDELMLRRHFKRYHRFFILSPFILPALLLVIYLSVRQGHGFDTGRVLSIFLALMILKELTAFGVSRRIYHQVLLPVEKLKQAVGEIASGNYAVQVDSDAVPEIRELIDAFNAMSRQLQESEALKQRYEVNRRELIASISHDLKTPITSINGFTDGILQGVADSPEKQAAYVKIIQQNARYMNRLIDDLLLYSKLDLHKLSFEFSPLPFAAYIHELFSELQLENEETGTEMALVSTLDPQRTLSLDPRHFTRALRNVVANALTHGHSEAPRITFLLSEEAGTVRLCIQDNGPGIAPDQLTHIFDRFYRADCARSTVTGGSGLGLAIAREIVQAHGGAITAESPAGEGARICITLPISKEEPHGPRNDSAD